MWKSNSLPTSRLNATLPHKPPPFSPHLCHRTPRHGDQNSTLHCLNQRHGLVDRFAPAFNTPRFLSSLLPLFQIGELPQMVNCIQLANLDEPGTDALHDFPAGFQTLSPMGFPFEKIARVECIGSQLEQATQLPRGRCGPERELLHQGNPFGICKSFELFVEGREVRVRGNRV